MYFKMSNCMKVIPLKIFVEGYLVTAVQAKGGRQGWVVLLPSQEQLQHCLLQEWFLAHQHQNHLKLC